MAQLDPGLQATVLEIVGAVQIMSAPHRYPRPTVVQATQFIEAFRQGSPHAAAIGSFLALSRAPDGQDWLPNGHEPHIRKFGLQLVTDYVRINWNETPPLERQQLKYNLYMLLQDGMRDLASEEPYLVRAASLVVAHVAVREWPQFWPSLAEDLFGLCRLGETQTALTIGVFGAIADEVFKFGSDINAKRKADLTNGLKACLPVLLPLLQQTLGGSWQVYRQCGGGTPAGLTHAHLITAALQVLTCFVDWVPLPTLFEHDFPVMFGQLLQDANFRRDAVDCLLLIVERRGSKGDRALLLRLFESIDLLTTAIPLLQGNHADIDVETYGFTKRLCQVLVLLGSNQLCPLWGTGLPTTTAPANFGPYLVALFQFSSHPSLLVQSFVLPLWIQLLHHDAAMRTPDMRAFLGPLLQYCHQRCPRPGDPEHKYVDAVVGMFCDEDIDSMEEFVEFFAGFRGRLLEIAKIIALAVPVEAAQFMSDLLSAVLTMQAGPGDVAANGACLPTGTLFYAWDGMAALLGSVVAGAIGTPETESPEVRQPVTAILRNCLQGLVVLKVEDALILSCLIGLVEACLPVLPYAPDLLMGAVDLLFAAVEFRLDEAVATSGAPGSQLGMNECAKARKRACVALVTLCSRPPAALLDNIQYFCTRVQEIMMADSVSEVQRKLLMEALLKAGNALDTMDGQAGFLSYLLTPVATLWTSPEISQALSTPENLVAWGGLEAQDDNYDAARQTIVNVCSAITVALTDTKSWTPPGVVDVPRTTANGCGGALHGGDGYIHPGAEHTARLLPNAFQLAVTLHSLYNLRGAAGAALAGALLPLLEMRRAEFASYLAGAGKMLRREYDAQELWVDRGQLWLGSLREFAYRIIGAAAKQGVLYSLPNLHDLLLNLISALPTIRKHHLRLFVKLIVNPLVRYAPRNSAALEALSVPIGVVYAFFRDLLNAQWALVAGRQEGCGVFLDSLVPCPHPVVEGTFPQGEEAGEQGGQLAEIVEDKLLGDLTLDVLVHLGGVLDDVLGAAAIATAAAVPEGRLADPNAGMMGRWVLGTPTLVVPVLDILLRCMALPSSAVCRQASTVLQAALPSMAKWPVAQASIADGSFIASAIAGLSVHGEHQDCETNLLTVICHAYAVACSVGSSSASDVLLGLGLPSLCAEDLAAYNAKVFRSSSDSPGLKVQRADMKRMLAPLIGVNVGQALKRAVKITDLPDMLFDTSTAKPTVDPDDVDVTGFLSTVFD